MSHDHHEPGMGELFQKAVSKGISEATPSIVASALINSGNALRKQGYDALGPITKQQLLTTPALLSDDLSLLLVPFIRPMPNMYRLVGAQTDNGRNLYVFSEDENNTLQSKFLALSDEAIAEINRQLDQISQPDSDGKRPNGQFQLGLYVSQTPVEGFEYYKPEQPVEEAPQKPE